ncbi:MAG: MiaB/RimO family radical SAM methylthiotransferase [Deltaproteobacteria bacterium]|nr:MiaB/RimO family radical SAM methylthiotransferase [Deltaproteobacteria bacterium]
MAWLGCKVNQAESHHLGRELAARGWERPAPGEPAELAVLLTCSVTAAAARQSRQMARRLARAHPGATVVVTGCDAQAEPAAYQAEGFRVLGRSELADLAARAARGEWPTELPGPPDAGSFLPGAWPPGQGRSRGLLKVQDGCDAHCAYCIVPSTRGRPRSLPLDQALEQWNALAAQGAREVVLTGIHLGRWGRDLTPPRELAALVAALLAAPGPRLRLSSLEGGEVSPELWDLARREPRLCRHFHLPLQSGCDRLLRAMGRPHPTAHFRRTVELLHRELPGVCLGADVMVGLPGEDAAAFRETRDFLASLPLAYLHVFPYSPRPGTPAAQRPGRPPGDLVKARAEELRTLGQGFRERFAASQVGAVLDLVVEGGGRGRSGNYCLVELPGGPPPGSLARMEITSWTPQEPAPLLRGRLIP